ncbi:MAG: HAMP domain-containing histidine kinase [Lachnospiraceae bacterium]|nr:HAMP domain-containing histidine kinase [Lachnospiraceae bacterium]
MRYFWPVLAAVFCVAFLATLIVTLIGARRRKKLIRELTDYITKVQDFETLPDMGKISEGEFGILQSEIYKVVTILREEYSSERGQKRYMSDMMSDISHQFKTPLTAISIVTELLMAPEVSAEQRLDYASKIESQTDRMTWLIRNLLTLSQLEAGVLEMKSEEIVLKKLMDEIAVSLEVMAEAADVSLDIRIPEEIVIKGDKRWFGEALTNIIKNGIEHTPAGGHVSVSATQNNIVSCIKIADDGKGISPEHLPHIFERFYKAGNTSTNSVGIGLAMAKQIINNHGGRIEAESDEGRGTCFIIKV